MPALLRAVSLDELADLGGEVRLELQVAHLQVIQQLLRQRLRSTARTSQNDGRTRKGWISVLSVASSMLVATVDSGI